MGKTQWRAIDGVVLLNKPLGLSSNQALQKVRRVFRAAKAGHTGALDPLATGMLPLCLGEATKFSQFLLDADKRYITCIELGIRTTTGDKEGDILTNET
ncbi:MAG: tRNA pseudouridine(55) synthase TruB, partial [Pseudomonadota bacterium]|nr:tRNA pseudouridine(55) synthase TruB [Pseudomonadota bacterium]